MFGKGPKPHPFRILEAPLPQEWGRVREYKPSGIAISPASSHVSYSSGESSREAESKAVFQVHLITDAPAGGDGVSSGSGPRVTGYAVCGHSVRAEPLGGSCGNSFDNHSLPTNRPHRQGRVLYIQESGRSLPGGGCGQRASSHGRLCRLLLQGALEEEERSLIMLAAFICIP